MARDEALPFARGESYSGGDSTLLAVDANGQYPGFNWEGKVFLGEPNMPSTPASLQTDPSGRYNTVKVVRNVSGVPLKPGRVVKFQLSGGTYPYETRVDGYCTSVSDRPAGVVDEFLPTAGVADKDLFFIVVNGPTNVVNLATSPVAFSPGDRLIVATAGATAGDDLGGRVGPQVLTGATSILANQIQNNFGFAATTAASTVVTVPAVVHLMRW